MHTTLVWQRHTRLVLVGFELVEHLPRVSIIIVKIITINDMFNKRVFTPDLVLSIFLDIVAGMGKGTMAFDILWIGITLAPEGALDVSGHGFWDTVLNVFRQALRVDIA